MSLAFIQFSDSTETAIISVVGCMQDPSVYANLGQIDMADPRYIAFMYPEQTIPGQLQACSNAIQRFLDSTAQSRGYDNLRAAVAYASQIPFVAPVNATPDQLAVTALSEKFRIEGNALQLWASQTWAEAIVYENKVIAGTEPLVTPEQAVAMMPTFTWPD